jgi:protein-S-isoprenylcysteine O-methyltransferase Ste14
MLQRLMRQWESPPTWLALFVGAVWVQAYLMPLIAPVPQTRHLGTLFIVGGIVLIGIAAVQFRAHKTTILPREVPATMIDTGLYGYSRNPIYVADALILAGCALRWDLAGLALVPLFCLVITRRFIRGEEAGMQAQFGAAYAGYAARVRQWV